MIVSNELRGFQRDQDLYEKVVGEIIRLWPRGGVHIDCGAHLGRHTKPMLLREDVRSVYALEAIPWLCDRLGQELGHYPKLTLVRGAVGNMAGEVEFSVATDAPGYSGLKERKIADVRKWEAITVPLRRLDEVVSIGDARDVGLIKLDIEGGEFDAMRGASGTIIEGKPLVVFENGLRSSADTYDYSSEDFFNFFKSLNYEVFDFFGNIVDANYWNETLQTYMFIALPLERYAYEWKDKILPGIVRDVLKR